MLWGEVNPRVGQLYSQPNVIKIFRYNLYLQFVCFPLHPVWQNNVVWVSNCYVQGKKAALRINWGMVKSRVDPLAVRSSLPIDWDDLELHLHIARLLEGGSCSNEGWIWGVRLASKWMTQLAVCCGSVKVQLCNSSFVKVAEIPHVDWSFPNTISCCVGYIWAWRISAQACFYFFLKNPKNPWWWRPWS